MFLFLLLLEQAQVQAGEWVQALGAICIPDQVALQLARYLGAVTEVVAARSAAALVRLN